LKVPSIFSSANIGCPAATLPTIGISIEALSLFILGELNVSVIEIVRLVFSPIFRKPFFIKASMWRFTPNVLEIPNFVPISR